MPLAGNLESVAELRRFQQGLAFINNVRSDIANQIDTQVCGPTKLDDTNQQTIESDSTKHNSKPHPIVGRFDIRKKIGEGGFASVYLAFDPVLNREVAVKVLNASINSNSEACVRFQP